MSNNRRGRNTAGIYNDDSSDAVLTKHPGDYIFYDISIPHNDVGNPSQAPTPAVFSDVRSTPLFYGDPRDYTLSVVRFTIPTQQIPIQIFPIQPNQSDINLSLYSVTLTWMAFARQVYLIWEPEDLTALVPPPSPDPNIKIYWPYYSLYNLDHFTRMINTALTTAFTQLQGDGAPITAAPFISFESSTRRFTLYSKPEYASDLVNPVYVYFNTALSGNIRQSMDSVRQSWNDVTNFGRDLRFNILNNNGINLVTIGATTYIATIQQYDSVVDMLSFTSLVILSNSLPVRSSWITLQSGSGPGLAPPPGIQSGSLKVLADFEIILDTGFELRTFAQYLPTAEYRRITLETTQPILNVDIQIFWKDNYDNLFPVMIPAHNICTIKLLFEKK